MVSYLIEPWLGGQDRCGDSQTTPIVGGCLAGSSRPRFIPEGDGSLFAAQSDLISLAGRMRSAGCRHPSLASSAEKEPYAKVAVASSKVRLLPYFP